MSPRIPRQMVRVVANPPDRNHVAIRFGTVLPCITSEDGSVTVTRRGKCVDLSVPVNAGAAASVLGFGAVEFAPGDIIGASLIAWSAGDGAGAAVAQGSVPAIIQVPAAGTISRLYVRQAIAPGQGALRTYTVWVDGAITLLAVTIQDLATEGSNLAVSVPVNAGSKVEVRVTGGIDTNAIEFVRADMQYCAPCT